MTINTIVSRSFKTVGQGEEKKQILVAMEVIATNDQKKLQTLHLQKSPEGWRYCAGRNSEGKPNEFKAISVVA